MITFANFPPCTDLDHLDADVAIMGIPYGTPYQPGQLSPSHHAPETIRRQSIRYPEDVFAWDFDLQNNLLAGSSLKVVDCGDLTGDVENPEDNYRLAFEAVKKILKAGVLPVILGGDDSIPIPVFAAFMEFGPINILQIDAHIDWRDEVNGIRYGFSSTMRRASEMDWIGQIIQVGARGTGTARVKEYHDALAYGAKIIPAKSVHQCGIESILAEIPGDTPCYVTVDCDGLDPSTMPGVWSPAPGGLTYYQVIELIHSVNLKSGLAGLNLVEYVPEKDINEIGQITAMRLIWNFIGELAQKKSTCRH